MLLGLVAVLLPGCASHRVSESRYGPLEMRVEFVEGCR
jgi:hypothetical protein